MITRSGFHGKPQWQKLRALAVESEAVMALLSRVGMAGRLESRMSE